MRHQDFFSTPQYFFVNEIYNLIQKFIPGNSLTTIVVNTLHLLIRSLRSLQFCDLNCIEQICFEYPLQ